MRFDDVKLYVLKARLISTLGDFSEEYSFERVIHVRLIETGSSSSVIYDPKLKKNFEKEKISTFIYEIEVDHINVRMPGELEKSQDFIRRINYRYDMLKLKINEKGIALDIVNTEEMKSTWKDLRTFISDDYTGKAVENYLFKLDKQLEDKEAIMPIMNQYFQYGLLFPQIPKKHLKEWRSDRLIELSEYEKEAFTEEITFKKNESGLRYYHINGQSLTESKTTVITFDGSLTVPENEMLTRGASMEVVFMRKNIINKWQFNLYNYK